MTLSLRSRGTANTSELWTRRRMILYCLLLSTIAIPQAVAYASLSPREAAGSITLLSAPKKSVSWLRNKGLSKSCGRPMLSFLDWTSLSFSLLLPLVHRIAVRMLPPLRLRERVGVLGLSFSCFLNDRLSLRLCPVGIGEDAVGTNARLSMLVGDDKGVEEAMVPSTPDRDVADAFLCERVAGMFFAATAIAGLCGELMAITKGMPVLDALLSLRSGRAAVE